MKTKDCFTELAIKIATVDMKLDAILKLLNKPEVELTNVISFTDNKHVGMDTVEIRSNPLQWPNEPLTEYLKRIGQYNEAQSIDEQFTETYK